MPTTLEYGLDAFNMPPVWVSLCGTGMSTFYGHSQIGGKKCNLFLEEIFYISMSNYQSWNSKQEIPKTACTFTEEYSNISQEKILIK